MARTHVIYDPTTGGNIVIPFTPEEEAAADAAEAAANAASLPEREAAVRAERNRLLAGSDWTQLADSPADKGAWATYRQALRDITSQPGFPDAVIWPLQPIG